MYIVVALYYKAAYMKSLAARPSANPPPKLVLFVQESFEVQDNFYA